MKNCLLGVFILFSIGVQSQTFQYIRVGNQQDVSPKTTPGYALLGGGSDLDEAFQWLCTLGGRGDFLILRAAGDDAYNPYINDLCKPNSVATLIIPHRDSASDPKVSEIISHAEAIFIAGGDQARYINFWMSTPVQKAINERIAAGVPVGGTSAGLAVLAQFIYSAQGDAPDDEGLKSSETLVDPYMPRVILRRDFLNIDVLRNILTDSHFAKRDRMGRSLTFLARIMKDGWSPAPREIAVDEKSGVLIERGGKARVIGTGKGAYFISTHQGPEVCRGHTPLTLRDITVYRAPAGAEFNLKDWKGKRGTSYGLSVVQGKIQSTQSGGEIY